MSKLKRINFKYLSNYKISNNFISKLLLLPNRKVGNYHEIEQYSL